MLYSPEAMEAFAAAAALGSFSAAARQLGKSQSTISTAIANLEADLDLTLFDRSSRLPVLTTAGIFTFIFTWDDFFGPLIYLNSISTYTVTIALRTFVDSTAESNWSGLFAMSILSLVPIFVIFLFFQRYLIEGIATTGMKR